MTSSERDKNQAIWRELNRLRMRRNGDFTKLVCYAHGVVLSLDQDLIRDLISMGLYNHRKREQTVLNRRIRALTPFKGSSYFLLKPTRMTSHTRAGRTIKR